MILEGLNKYYANKQCNICAKQYFCNKKECKPIWWHNTKGYGIPERKEK